MNMKGKKETKDEKKGGNAFPLFPPILAVF